MNRVVVAVVLIAGVTLLAGVHSAAPPGRVPVTSLPLVDRMYAEVSFPCHDDPKTTLFEILEEMTRRYDVEFDVQEKAFKFEMLNDVLKTEVANPTPVPAMKAPIGEILRRILNKVPVPSGAVWLLRKNHVEVTTGAFAKTEVAGKDLVILAADPDTDTMGEDEAGRFLLALPLLHADFEKTPLAEALTKAADRTERNIVLDETVVKEYGKVPVTARLRNVRVDVAVLLLASQAGLGMARLDNTFVVTTEDKAGKLAQRLTETRPVRPPKPAAKKAAEPPKGLSFPFPFGSGIHKVP